MLVTNFHVKYVLYKIVCAFYQLADVGRVHPARERTLRALKTTVDYIEEMMPEALGFENQRELTAYALGEIKLEGHYLEFGVFTGGTMRFIARRIGGRTIHGFDSFEGLPQPWGGFNLGKRAFDVGWFDDSLPPWAAANPGPVAFIHIDCDLYSSTRTIFQLLGDRMVPGTIILFDEYFNYPNWERHEFKALQELVAERRLKYTYLAYARQQVVVRIDSVGGSAT
jgi:hypothetical protein